MNITMEEEQNETRNMRPLYKNEDLAKRYIKLIENDLDLNTLI